MTARALLLVEGAPLLNDSAIIWSMQCRVDCEEVEKKDVCCLLEPASLSQRIANRPQEHTSSCEQQRENTSWHFAQPAESASATQEKINQETTRTTCAASAADKLSAHLLGLVGSSLELFVRALGSISEREVAGEDAQHIGRVL